jgi:DNA-binding PadR family transcriptional regulator
MLEDEGLVRVEQTEGRRVFHLTDAGQAYVEKHREELTAAWKAVVESVDDKGQELRELLHQVGNALRQVAHEGTVTQIAAARTLLTNTRRQLYRILAEDESSDTDQP